MGYNLFSRAYIHRQRPNKNDLENFCTEVFTYILQSAGDLEEKKDEDKYIKECARKILKLFGIDSLIDIKGKDINTQDYYKVGKQRAIPDIVINFKDNDGKNKNHIIEVKVDADVGKRTFDNGKVVTQLEFYEKIDDLDNIEVFLLTRDVPKDAHSKFEKRYWYEIYSIFNQYKIYNEIIYNFFNFMGENMMKDYTLKGGNGDIFESIAALQQKIIDYFKVEKYVVKDGYATGKNYGCHVYLTNEEVEKEELIAYIYQTRKFKDFIQFSLVKNAIIENEANQRYKDINGKDMEENEEGQKIFASLSLEKITRLNSKQEQESEFSNWLRDAGIEDLLSWYHSQKTI